MSDMREKLIAKLQDLITDPRFYKPLLIDGWTDAEAGAFLDQLLDTLREPDEGMKFEGMQADFNEGANYAFEFAGAAFTAMIDHVKAP